jgi:transcriptional regulator with XRE-family HTH domain
VPDARSPTVRRRELGALLRGLRLERGLTVEQVAGRLLCSPSKVSRMETGQRGATLRDVRDLCEFYGVTDEAQIARLMDLARGGKEQGWWQSYDLVGEVATYVGLESEAIATKYYHSTVIPGLLQTADYARAMHETVLPPPEPERIDELVKVRLMRQELLKRDPPLAISAVIDEAALHRVVGGAPTMRAQLEQLNALARLPRVSIQVIGYAAGAHPAMDSTFRILEFGSTVPDVVYVEGLVGFLYLDRAQDVARYERVFEYLSEIALSPQESMKLIAKIGVIYENASV